MAKNWAESCPDAIAKGKVCSHAVTVDQLRGWGIDSERNMDHGHEPGIMHHKAVHMAWQRGLVKLCVLDPREDPWPRHIKPQSEESIKDVLEWIRTHKYVSSSSSSSSEVTETSAS